MVGDKRQLASDWEAPSASLSISHMEYWPRGDRRPKPGSEGVMFLQAENNEEPRLVINNQTLICQNLKYKWGSKILQWAMEPEMWDPINNFLFTDKYVLFRRKRDVQVCLMFCYGANIDVIDVKQLLCLCILMCSRHSTSLSFTSI